jgi:hypothetical protein
LNADRQTFDIVVAVRRSATGKSTDLGDGDEARSGISSGN